MKTLSKYHLGVKAKAEKRRDKIEKMHFDCELSFREIGRRLGISGARAEQICNFRRKREARE